MSSSLTETPQAPDGEAPGPERQLAEGSAAVPPAEGGNPPGDGVPQARDGRRRASRRRTWLLAAIVALVISVLAWSAVTVIGAGDQLRGAQQATAHERHELAVARYVLVLARQRLAKEISQGQTTQATLERTDEDILQAKSALSGSDAAIDDEGIDINTLDTCLTGVQQALNDTGQGDQAGAISAIQSVSTPCLSLDTVPSGSPVYPFDFPDPSVILAGTTYYAYGTNSAAGNIQIVSSTDLTHWTAVGNALPSVPAWAASGDTWAPSVIQLGNTYLMYYTVKDPSTGVQCISVATSSAPTGPFLDSSTAPLECQPTLGGSIDPDPFIDASGQLYLAWKSEGAGGQPPTLWSQTLDAAGTGLQPGGTPAMLLQPSQGWEDGIVEAPEMVAAGTGYDLLYSGANWSSSSYAIGEASCHGPLGPCSKPLSGPMLQSGSDFDGPGGPAVFHDAAGNLWLAFAAFLPGAVGYPNSRLLFLRQLQMSGGLLTTTSSTS